MTNQESAARLTATVQLIARNPNVYVNDIMFQTLRGLVTDPERDSRMREMAWQALAIASQGDRRRLQMVANLKRRQQRVAA